MLEPETHEPLTKNISLIKYIEDAIAGKIKLDERTINSIVTTSWGRVYPHFANSPKKDAFLALSPFFSEKAKKTSITTALTATAKLGEESRWQNLAPYDLFIFIKESPAALTQVIKLGYFPKLLEGNFINEKRVDYIDPFYLLSLVLKQENLEAKEKANALLLLQEKLDITDIAYFNTLKEFASAAEFSTCFKGHVARERWIKDKNGQYFDLWLPNANITSYIQKMHTSFDKEKFDSVLLKAVIANKENANYNYLLKHNSGGVKSQVYQHVKNLINAIPSSFQINISLRRLLEDCILNLELRSLFSDAELYKVMHISSLHPVCHKVIAYNPDLRKSLISFAKVSNILNNLYRLNPYFYLEQFIAALEFSEEEYVDFLAELILAETGAIRNIETIKEMQGEFLKVFPYEKLAPYFAADEQLRDKLVKKFKWPKREQFEQYPFLLLFALNNAELLQKENDPAKKIVMCLQLMEYRKQGCRIKENLDEHMATLLDKHLDLVVEKIGDNNKVAKKIYYLAKDEQRKKLIAKNPDLFASYKSIDDKEETKIPSKPTPQQRDSNSLAALRKFKTLTFGRKSNVSKLEVPGLSEELRKRIAGNLDPEFLEKAATILNNFLQDETLTINLLKDPFKFLAEKLSLKMQEAELTQIVLELEEEKGVLKSQVGDTDSTF